MRKLHMTLLLVVACTFGCAQVSGVVGAKSEEQRTLTSQIELQQNVQRFSTDFTARVLDALQPLENSPDAAVREAARRRTLVYASSALEIATESMPELTFLDMVVFLTLSHATVEEYWVPEVFGDDGRELARVMRESKDSIWEMAGRLMDARQQAVLVEVIHEWRERNPDFLNVEGVRFGEFSVIAGRISARTARDAEGLLASVRSVTNAADRAVLLGERSLFLANRMPFLMRLQARVGSTEILADTATHMASAEGLLVRAGELQPMVQDLTTLSEHAGVAAAQATQLADAMRPFLSLVSVTPARAHGDRGAQGNGDVPARSGDVIDRMQALSETSLELVEELRALAPSGNSDVAARMESLLRRWLVLLVGAGALLIVMFWTGYAVAHRLAQRRGVARAGA